MERLLALAEATRDWPMPGYTHLQRAQPVYLGHHLLAYFWMLERDAARFDAAASGRGGAAARLRRARRGSTGTSTGRGCARSSASTGDAELNRRRLEPRLRARLPLRGARSARCTCRASGPRSCCGRATSSASAKPAEDFSSGSSIMPQKKNPDAAELLRAKAPRVYSSFLTLAGVMHGLPLAYSKDLQEDKEALFDAVDNLELCLEAAERMLEGLSFDRERLAEAAADEFPAATDVADLLVRKGMPFREAHGVVGGLVRDALEQGKPLSELTPERPSPSFGAARRLLLRGARFGFVAREQGLGGRDGVDPGCRAARGRPGEACRAGGGGQSVIGPRCGGTHRSTSGSSIARSTRWRATWLGCSLSFDGVGGVIVETESYERDDPACHAFAGLTREPRRCSVRRAALTCTARTGSMPV